MGFQFTIDRQDLFRAISSLQNITNKKGTLAILSNILISVEQAQVIFTATDLEIGLKQTLPAEIASTGELTLPAKKLFELVRESSSPTLTFKELSKKRVEITADTSQYKLSGISADEYPQFPEYEESHLVEMDAIHLCDLVDKTIFSVAQDKENMFSLTAALLEKVEEDDKVFLKMISSDGHRLTIMTKEVNDSVKGLHVNPITLIPRRGIQEIRKFAENRETIFFGIEKDQAVVKTESALLIVRLIEGEFPDYQNILNVISTDNNIFVNRVRFLESLKRINLFTEDLFHAIKMEIDGEQIVLTSQNADFGSAKDEFTIEYNGVPLSLGFNCRYFIETLQVIEGETVVASINSETSPCMITSPDTPGFYSIIMPMKL